MRAIYSQSCRISCLFKLSILLVKLSISIYLSNKHLRTGSGYFYIDDRCKLNIAKVDMQNMNVKGHKIHLEWRMDVLSLRRTLGWSAYKITSRLWDRYKPNDISKEGLLSFVRRTIKRGTVQNIVRSGRPRAARTTLNIREVSARHRNKPNPGQRSTAQHLNISQSSVQWILKQDLNLKPYHKTRTSRY